MGRHRWPITGDAGQPELRTTAVRRVGGGRPSGEFDDAHPPWEPHARRAGITLLSQAKEPSRVGDDGYEGDEPYDDPAPYDDDAYDVLRPQVSDEGRGRQPRVRWGIARSAALVFLGVALAVGAALFLVRSSEPSAAAVSVELDAERGGAAGSEGASGDSAGPASGVSSGDSSDTGAAAIPPSGAGAGSTTNRESETSSGSDGGDPTASRAAELVVYVTGAVGSPGIVSVPVGTRLFDVLERVGGPLPEADLEGINLAGEPVDGEHIHVLAVGEDPRPGVGAEASGGVPAAGEPAGGGAGDLPEGTAGGTSAGVIDINTATLAEIEALPRVGPVLGQRIIEWRETQGPFARAADIDAVPGIGPAMLEGILPLITAG